jgi:hypothetical protein
MAGTVLRFGWFVTSQSVGLAVDLMPGPGGDENFLAGVGIFSESALDMHTDSAMLSGQRPIYCNAFA